MCIGPFRRACHWGPLMALGIMKCVTLMTVHCSSMWWPPANSWAGFINMAVFLGCSGFTMFHFFCAMLDGPGFLPQGWKPEPEVQSQYLQYCSDCEGYKAPRAHHCRKCKKCVLKMDHHCPWINNCVGHFNHGHFIGFLFFAVCGCSQSTVILICTMYRALNKTWYLYYGPRQPLVSFGIYGMVMCMFTLGLAIGVVLAVGMLLYFQLKVLIRNQTGIEDWIMEKARYRRQGTSEKFVFPYHLGWWKNIRQVLTWSCDPASDGVHWPVVDGCDQYTLTCEQLIQKQQKRHRTREYTIVEDYSGAWVPVSKGCKIICNVPYTDEPRIKVEKGDKVLVTRWKKFWLYGEKIQEQQEDPDKGGRLRGWFPRCCAVEIINGEPESLDPHTQQKNK